MERLGRWTPKPSVICQQIVNGRNSEVAEALSKLASA